MIGINLEKARATAHALRRSAREAAFAPHDAIIARQIPGTSAQEAEAARQEIRSRFTTIQEEIEASTTVEAFHEIINREGLTA